MVRNSSHIFLARMLKFLLCLCTRPGCRIFQPASIPLLIFNECSLRWKNDRCALKLVSVRFTGFSFRPTFFLGLLKSTTFPDDPGRGGAPRLGCSAHLLRSSQSSLFLFPFFFLFFFLWRKTMFPNRIRVIIKILKRKTKNNSCRQQRE